MHSMACEAEVMICKNLHLPCEQQSTTSAGREREGREGRVDGSC